MQWICYLTAALILTLFSGTARTEEILTEAIVETDNPSLSIPLSAETPGNQASQDYQLPGQENLFGGRTGYIHPFLAVSTLYTSNLFRTADNEQSDRYAVIVPGLWLALPASNRRYPEIATSNTAPGGLSLSRFTTESVRRVQGYALYQANILRHDRYQEEDRVDHRGQGMFKLSSRRGSSLEIVDVYERNSDPYGTGGSADRTLDTFDANLFNVIVVSRLSPKVLLRADYGLYHLNYADTDNSYRNRSDDSYSGYLFFQATPRTALFVQGEYITIDYKEEINSDSRHNNYYLGIQLQPNVNSRGRFKIGYGLESYGPTESGNLLAEAQLDYFFTPKTSVYLQGTRRVLETDVIGARSILSYQETIGYRQRLTSKVRGDAALFFNRNDYNGTVSIGNRIATDYYNDEFGGRITLGFSPVVWMDFSLGYEYLERDANFDTEDYRSHNVFLRAAAAF